MSYYNFLWLHYRYWVSSGLFGASFASFGVRQFYHYFTAYRSYSWWPDHGVCARSIYTKLAFSGVRISFKNHSNISPKCNSETTATMDDEQKKITSTFNTGTGDAVFTGQFNIILKVFVLMENSFHFYNLSVWNFTQNLANEARIQFFFIFSSHSGYSNYLHFVIVCHLQHHESQEAKTTCKAITAVIFRFFLQRTILTKTTINTEKQASDAFSNWQTN